LAGEVEANAPKPALGKEAVVAFESKAEGCPNIEGCPKGDWPKTDDPCPLVEPDDHWPKADGDDRPKAEAAGGDRWNTDVDCSNADGD
jgi:hypothetical protein